MGVRSLGQEDPLGEGTATYTSILAWRILGTEVPGVGVLTSAPQSVTVCGHGVAKSRTPLSDFHSLKGLLGGQNELNCFEQGLAKE